MRKTREQIAFNPEKSLYQTILLKSLKGDVKKARAVIKNSGFPVFNFRGGKKKINALR